MISPTKFQMINSPMTRTHHAKPFSTRFLRIFSLFVYSRGKRIQPDDRGKPMFEMADFAVGHRDHHSIPNGGKTSPFAQTNSLKLAIFGQNHRFTAPDLHYHAAFHPLSPFPLKRARLR